jgi:FkbM family methyltransferase
MKRAVVILFFLCSLFILITMLEFYRSAQHGGNGEFPHATSLTGNSVLNILRMALPTHVFPERIDFCSNRAPKNIFFDVGSNRGDVLHAFLYKQHLKNSNNPNWKFAEEYDPATYDVYGFEAIPSFAKSLEHKFPKVHIVNAAVWNESGKEVSISIDPDKKNSNWGSSLIRKWSRDIVTVNTLDFAAFVKEHVCLKDNVHLKLNIEGSEYVVMDHLIKTDTLQLFDCVYMYFHVLFFPQKEKANITNKTVNYQKIVKQLGIKIAVWSVHV